MTAFLGQVDITSKNFINLLILMFSTSISLKFIVSLFTNPPRHLSSILFIGNHAWSSISLSQKVMSPNLLTYTSHVVTYCTLRFIKIRKRGGGGGGGQKSTSEPKQ